MILPYRDKQPLIEETAYVSSNATVIGDVTLEKGSSIWFHSVVRGDKDHIHIGEDSNIQDNCTLHTDPKHLLQIGKGALVKEGQQIPENSLAVGSPARIIRKCSEEQVKEILENAAHYAQLGSEYKKIDV